MIASSLMTVHDLYFDRVGTFLRPLEAVALLVVDADAPLLLAPILECLQQFLLARGSAPSMLS